MLPLNPMPPAFLQTDSLATLLTFAIWYEKTQTWSDIPKQKGSLTSQIPSIQTSFLFGEQGVPSFTLLDIAKKNSKFSALQYSLHRSSSRSKESKIGHGQEEITGQRHALQKDELHLFKTLAWSKWKMLLTGLCVSVWVCVCMLVHVCSCMWL